MRETGGEAIGGMIGICRLYFACVKKKKETLSLCNLFRSDRKTEKYGAELYGTERLEAEFFAPIVYLWK